MTPTSRQYGSEENPDILSDDPVNRSSALVLRIGRPCICMAASIMLLLALSGCRGKTAGDYVKAGDQAVHANQPDDAIKNYLEAIKLEPKSFEAHMKLARIYSDRTQFDAASEQFRAAAAIDPANVNAHLGLAATMEALGKFDDAERELRTAVGLAPQNALAHYALAKLLDKEGSHDAEAQREYGKAATIDPSLARAAQPVPSSTPAPPSASPQAAASASTAPAPSTLKIKTVNKNFQLTHDSPVYRQPDGSSSTVGHVHQRKYVHVVGITGNWLQIKLRNGVVGFIPVSAAE